MIYLIIGILIGVLLSFLYYYFIFDGIIIMSDDSKWIVDLHKDITKRKIVIFRVVKK